jgi:hypothetical protein
MSTVSPSNHSNKKDHGALGVGAIQKMVDLIGEQASEGQRVAVLVVGVAGVISLVVGLALIPAKQPVLAVVLVALAFLLMAVALIVALLAVSKSSQQAPSTPVEHAPQRHITHQWSRMVPRQKIYPEYKLREFKKPLEDLRGVVEDAIARHRRRGSPKITRDLIRSNIFLARPDRTEVYCEPIQLFIPSQLHSNMDYPGCPDRYIVFRGHEGLTGRTFTLGEAFGARAQPNGSGGLDWSAVKLTNPPIVEDWNSFELTKQQQDMIEKRIRWIVSIPIHHAHTDPKDTTMGVLNVDGLDHLLEDEEMQAAAKAMQDRISQFARAIQFSKAIPIRCKAAVG